MKQPSARTGLHMLTGTLSIFLANLLILPTGFITAVFLARRLGPAAYGLYALAIRLILWIEWTHASFFADATIKFVSEVKDWRPIGYAIIRIHFLVSLCVAILTWFMAPALARLFMEPVLDFYFKLLAVEIPIYGLARANGNILMGRKLYQQRALINAFRWTARLGLIVLFVEMGYSVPGAIIGSIGASLLELIISTFYVRSCLFCTGKITLRKFWGFTTPLFLSNLSQRIFRLDIFALKALGGTAAQAGFYGAAMNLTLPANIFSQSVSPPLLSTLTNLLSQEDHTRAIEIGSTTLRVAFCLIPLATAMAGCANEIFILIFGPRYLPAVSVFALLVFAAWFLIIINLSRSILIALGRPKLVLLLTGPMVPLGLIGYLLVIPELGGVGAAVVTTVVAGLGASASLLATYRSWKIPPPLRTIFNSAVCAALAFGLAFFWPAPGFMIIIKLIVITLAILMAFYLLGEITPKEIDLIKTLLQLRKRVNNHS